MPATNNHLKFQNLGNSVGNAVMRDDGHFWAAWQDCHSWGKDAYVAAIKKTTAETNHLDMNLVSMVTSPCYSIYLNNSARGQGDESFAKLSRPLAPKDADSNHQARTQQ